MPWGPTAGTNTNTAPICLLGTASDKIRWANSQCAADEIRPWQTAVTAAGLTAARARGRAGLRPKSYARSWLCWLGVLSQPQRFNRIKAQGTFGATWPDETDIVAAKPSGEAVTAPLSTTRLCTYFAGTCSLKRDSMCALKALTKLCSAGPALSRIGFAASTMTSFASVPRALMASAMN
jgi:hypothetical protein